MVPDDDGGLIITDSHVEEQENETPPWYTSSRWKAKLRTTFANQGRKGTSINDASRGKGVGIRLPKF